MAFQPEPKRSGGAARREPPVIIGPVSREPGWRGAPADSPRERVLALSAFYGTGGVLCLISLVLPAWPGRDLGVVLWVGVVAVSVAGVLAVIGRRVSTSVCYALVIFGTVLISLLLLAGAGGAASATYAGFYIWVGVYCFLFFSPRAAALQVLFAMGCELAALSEIGQGAEAPAQLALSFGTVVATATVVGLLSTRMRALTVTDGLTGLPNRRALDLALQDRLGRDRRHPVAVLAVDLDGFKAFNDTFGHAAGDRLLQQVATLWTAELRHGDVLTRCGGDEFVAVLNDCDDIRAAQVAARLVKVIPEPVSACIGLLVVPDGRHTGRDDVPRILDEVDQALYAGKAQGLGTVITSVWQTQRDRSTVATDHHPPDRRLLGGPHPRTE